MPIINHQAVQLNWITPQQITNPKTLVLGSFNPYNANGLLDYYYGRSSNFFWRRIAVIMGFNELHFFDVNDGLNRKLQLMANRFSCLDIINNIKFIGGDENLINEYINSHVYTNFSDGKIFVSQANGVQLKRIYNTSIVEILRTTTSINKVIHTMGNNRISLNRITQPLEVNLGINGFMGFMNSIYDICEERNIEIVSQSLSPSAYAVRTRAVNLNDLDNWLTEHLNLNN